MIDNPYDFITDTQKQFVTDRGAALDNRGWCLSYEHNLFSPLHPGTLRDFEDDGEISAKGAGRIAAPYGSTSLAINVFDVWRGSDLAPLGDAIGHDLDEVVGYEKGHSLGFKRPAQPDIEFRVKGGTPLAVEVKLREPYGRVSNGFAERYFETPGLWDGLPNLCKLAERIDSGEVKFTTLHAAQLIKHALGLHRSYEDRFVLGYLWHYVPTEIGDNHLRELEEFTAVADADISIMSITVEELLGGLDVDRCDSAWFTYMTDRYVTPLGR